MEIHRLDDYQSWAIRTAETTVVIDPWLIGECVLPGGAKVFRRTHETPPVSVHCLLDSSVTALMLTAHFGDHFHEETLRMFPRETPVYTTKWGAKQAQKLGFKVIKTMVAEEVWGVGPDLRVTTVAPAFPYSHNSLGFFFEDQSGKRILLETHGAHPGKIPARAQGADVLITAVEAVRFLGVPLTLGESRLVDLILEMKPGILIPTGTAPHRSEGVIPKLLSTKGSVKEFANTLKGLGVSTLLKELDVDEKAVL